MTTMAYGNPSDPFWIRSAFGGFFETMGLVRAARECKAARKGRRTPSPAALRTLGIDATAFNRIYTHH